MSFDDYEGAYYPEPYEPDDLDEWGQRESFEDSQAEMEEGASESEESMEWDQDALMEATFFPSVEMEDY